jgi:hypothetical protein
MELKCGVGIDKKQDLEYVMHTVAISNIEFMVGRLNVPIYITNLSNDYAIYPIDIWALNTAQLLCHLT